MSVPRSARPRLTRLALAVVAALLAFLAPMTPARAQSVAGEAGGIPESGSLSLAGALASAALDPSTGVFTATLPFEMPPARGGAQPGLALTYNSAAGIRQAGVGWGLDLPSIERRNVYGPPRYIEPSAANWWDLYQTSRDRFVFAGQPLVLICRVKGSACNFGSGGVASIAAHPLPDWATENWLYFRLEADTSRTRFYWSPNGKTWRVQFAGSGEILELGEPLVQRELFGDPIDAGIDYDAVRELAAAVQRHPFRWNAVRRYDAQSERIAANLVAYRWARVGNRQRGFLTDVYDTPSATLSSKGQPQAADFAHHAKLSWDSPPFLRGVATESFRSRPIAFWVALTLRANRWMAAYTSSFVVITCRTSRTPTAITLRASRWKVDAASSVSFPTRRYHGPHAHGCPRHASATPSESKTRRLATTAFHCLTRLDGWPTSRCSTSMATAFSTCSRPPKTCPRLQSHRHRRY